MSEYPTCKCGATYDPKVGRDGGWQHRPGCEVTVCPYCGHDTAAPARSPEGWPPDAAQQCLDAAERAENWLADKTEDSAVWNAVHLLRRIGKDLAAAPTPEGWPSEEQIARAAKLADYLRNRAGRIRSPHDLQYYGVADAQMDRDIAEALTAPAAPAGGAEWERPILMALGYFKSIAEEAGRWGEPAQARYDAALAALSSPSPPGWEEARARAQARYAEIKQAEADGRAIYGKYVLAEEIIRSLRAPSPAGATERYLKHCEACGTLTDTNSCDCTRDGKEPHFVPWLLADLEAAEQARASSATDAAQRKELYREIIARGKAEQREARYREALELCMIGGNHIATYRTDKWPTPGTDHNEALERLGAGREYDMWCCWNAIMRARAALRDAPSPSGME